MESHDVGNSYQDPVDYLTGKNDPGRDINQVTKKQQAGLPVKVKQGAEIRSKSNKKSLKSR